MCRPSRSLARTDVRPQPFPELGPRIPTKFDFQTLNFQDAVPQISKTPWIHTKSPIISDLSGHAFPRRHGQGLAFASDAHRPASTHAYALRLAATFQSFPSSTRGVRETEPSFNWFGDASENGTRSALQALEQAFPVEFFSTRRKLWAGPTIVCPATCPTSPITTFSSTAVPRSAVCQVPSRGAAERPLEDAGKRPLASIRAW
jgi:hypothetical protein